MLPQRELSGALRKHNGPRYLSIWRLAGSPSAGIGTELIFLSVLSVFHFFVLGVVEGSISFRRRAAETSGEYQAGASLFDMLHA